MVTGELKIAEKNFKPKNWARSATIAKSGLKHYYQN